MMHLEASALRCVIGKRTILDDVDLVAPSGSMTAIVGTNGTGKSTLLRALAGLRPTAAGVVRVAGQRLDQLSAKERARRISFVGQEEQPAEDLLVGELIALGRTPHSRPWETGGAEERRAVMDALEKVGVAELADRPCDALSGGERRRVLLARGLAQECPVMMLDEPTNHLDVSHQHHLLELVRGLDCTTILAIHDLDLAYRYADQVVVLHDGGVLASGPPALTLEPTVIRRAFGMRATRLIDPESGEEHLVTVPVSPSIPLTRSHV